MRKRIAIAGAVIGTTAGIGISRVARTWRTWGVDPDESDQAARQATTSSRARPPSRRGRSPSTRHPRPSGRGSSQMGYDRAGWYSYDQLDMGGSSAVRILPEYRALEVGDVIPTSPTSGFVVRVVEPRRALVLYSDTAIVRDQAATAATLDAQRRAGRPGGVGRVPGPGSAGLRGELGIRARAARRRPDPADRALPRPVRGSRPGRSASSARSWASASSSMVRRQMLGIKERAEITAVAPPVERPQVTATRARPTAIGRTGGRDGGRGCRSLTPEERGPHAPGGRSGPCRGGRVALDAVGLAAMTTDIEPARPARRARPLGARPSVPPSGIRRFFDIAATMDDVISLGVGEPDFDTPRVIVEAGVESLREGRTHYTSNFGTLELRRALSRHLERALRRPLRPGDRAAGHRRGVGGGRPGAARDVRPGRRGDPPRAVVRRVRPGHRLRRRRRAPRRDPLRGRLRAGPGRRRGGHHAADQGAVPGLPVQPDRGRPAATTSPTRWPTSRSATTCSSTATRSTTAWRTAPTATGR